MDKYMLRIACFTKKDLNSFFSNIEKIDRISIDFIEAKIDTPASYNVADVIIVSTDMDQVLIEKIFKTKASYAELILIGEPDTISEYNDEYLSRFFEIWNFNKSKILHYRIHSFVKRMRSVFDAELANKQLDTLIDSLPDLIWYKDIIGAHIKVNNSFCNTVNKTKEQIKDRGHCYIWDLDIEEYKQGEFVCMETEEVVINEQKTFLFDEKVKIGDEMRQLKTYKSAIVGRNNETLGTVGFARDVTDVWNTHEEFRTLMSRLPFPMMILNDNYKFVASNELFESLFNNSKHLSEDFDIDEFGEKIFKSDIACKDRKSVILDRLVEKNNLISNPSFEKEFTYYIIEKSPIHDVFGKTSGYFYIFRDDTDRRMYEEKLAKLAEIDELTQINNRKGLRKFFDLTIEEVIETKAPFAIVMLDIDYFKKYNDHYGHLDGDKVIIALAEILNQEQCGTVYAARFGGEEFILVMKDRSLEDVEKVIKNIRENLGKRKIPHIKSDISPYVTVSMGLVYHNNITSKNIMHEIIEAADKALYKAKESGRNTYHITENKNYLGTP